MCWTGPVRVLKAHQLVPDAPLVVVGHLDQLQSTHPVDPPGHADGRGDRPAEPARPAAPVVVGGSGQCKAVGGFQSTQGPQAAGELRPPVGAKELEQFADLPADRGAAGRARCRQQRLDACQARGARQGGRNPVLLVHALGMAQQRSIC